MRRGVTTLALVVVAAAAILYGGSALLFRRHVASDLPVVLKLVDPASVAEGGRLAAIVGCTRCHGADGRGRILTDVPHVGRIVAPSLAQVAAQATDGQLARAIRNGVGINARPLYMMPSHALGRLADDDVARLVAWLRTLRTSAFDVIGTTPVGMGGRFAILTGMLPDAVDLSGGQAQRRPDAPGAYFAQAACAQCHAQEGAEPRLTIDGRAGPSLGRGAALRDAARLRALLHAGADYHRGLASLSGAEIEAIRAHLLARGASSGPQ